MSSPYTTSETFNSVDAAWLHMDKPTNLAVINGVLAFDGELDLERLRATIESRLLIHRRFRQRVVEPAGHLGPPKWELDPDFNLDEHLQIVSLPNKGDHNELQALVSDLMSEPLDLSKPLWKLYIVQNYNHGSALICRLHHCIADGLALVQVLLSTTDVEPDAPWPEPPEKPRQRQLSPLARLLRPAVKVAMDAGSAWRSAEERMQEGLYTLVQPNRMLEAARTGISFTQALGKLLLIPPDKETILRGGLGVAKRAAWSPIIKLEQVKAIGEMMGGTVNDILISAITGALQRYLQQRGQFVEGLNIRAIVPVNLRPPGDRDLMGNRFGLVFLSLPVGIQDPLKRLTVLKRRMDAIKNSPEAFVAFGILSAVGITPKYIEKIIVEMFAMKASTVITNVPGPRQQLYFCGCKIDQLMFWVPTPGNLGVGISILSYADEVVLGVATDERLVPDPEAILEDFIVEFDQLGRWGRPTHSSDPPARQDPNRCQALTKTGRQCKNRAQSGTSFCQVHQLSDSG